MSYTLSQAEFVRLKKRLTYRENRLKKALATVREARMDPPTRENKELLVAEAKQLLKEATYATDIFDEQGYPDAHHRWERAKQDAEFHIRRNGGVV